MIITLAGVDEVGRGPLAGAMVTAAVILRGPIEGLTDSKKLTVKKREALAEIIKNEALCFSFGRAEVEEIDRLNIHHATLLAMKRAIEGLSVLPDKVLVDGLFVPQVSMLCQAMVKGDLNVPEISAASIIAKVARDQEMHDLDKIYPGYGFAAHKGYATAEHTRALIKLGPCAIHRVSYQPVRDASENRVAAYSTE